MSPLPSAPPRVRLSISHPLHAAVAALMLLSIACNISAIGNAVDRGDAFEEVVEQTNEEGKRMEKEYPPGDVAVPGVQIAPLPPTLPPPPRVKPPSPPALTGVRFPSELPGDGTPKGGWLTFTILAETARGRSSPSSALPTSLHLNTTRSTG